MHGLRSVPVAARIVLAILLAGAALAGPATAPLPAEAAGLSAWHGGIDLYRSGVYTTQKTWLWCTAADVQIIRNIVDRKTDHTRASQSRYFSAMRAHNRYRIPVSDGVDPAGWTYGLRHFVDSRYRLVSSGSFNAALRSAVTSLRKTNLPVGITVSHGNHAWVLTGFTATADPAATTKFTVTSVRVTGPLWGLQSRSYGYDMRPDTKLTPKQLAGFFTPWHYAKVRMAWEGRWVSIQPIGKVATATLAPKPTPTPRPSAPPSPSASPPQPSASLTNPSASATASAAGGLAAGVASPSAGGDPSTAPVTDVRAPDDAVRGLIVGGAFAALVIAIVAARGVRARGGGRRASPGSSTG